MCFLLLPAFVSDNRFAVGKFQYLANLNIFLIPFENQKTAVTQNTETLGETLSDSPLPVLALQCAIFLSLPARFFRRCQVRRVKNHHSELAVGKLHICEVADNIGLNL